jgi:hypothetical protein
MKNTRIKLFEDFAIDLLVDKVYEEMMQSFIYESDMAYMDSDDDEESYAKELTSGEKAAFARDFQIITPEQLAAIYLRALGKSEGDTGKYLVMIPGMEQFGDKDRDSRAFKITLPAFADAIGLESQATGMIVTGKFINLLNGSEEYQSQIIAPKIIKAFYKFSGKSPSEIAGLAANAIQDPSFMQNRTKAEDALDKAAEYRKNKKVSDVNTGMKVFSLINSLRSASPIFSDIKKAQKSAIAKIAAEINQDPEKIKKAYAEYLRTKGLLSDKMYFSEK